MASNISIQRLNRWIEKQFNIKGGPTLLDVESAIRVDVVILSGVETRALEGWNRYVTFAQSPAVAAVFSAIRFRNPPGSNVIAVFEKVLTFSPVLDNPQLRLQAGSTDFATPVVSQRADPRGQLLPTLIATLGSNASQQGGNFITTQTVANGNGVDFILTHDSEIVVAPGDSLTLWSNVVNTAASGSFTWRERALETSELTG